MPDLSLTLKERLLLVNQLRILQHLDPGSDYTAQIEIVERGYEYLYNELTNTLSDPLEQSVSSEVYGIFNMFRALHGSIRRSGDKSLIDMRGARFEGYDGNEESGHFSFAKFVVEKLNKYGESKPVDGNYNTHSPVLPTYRRMFTAWRALGARYELTRDEILQVIEAGQAQR